MSHSLGLRCVAVREREYEYALVVQFPRLRKFPSTVHVHQPNIASPEHTTFDLFELNLS